MFAYWDWFDTIITSIVILALVILLPVIFADHRIQCYYLETTPRESGFMTYDIKGHKKWWADSTVFRSLNFDETFQTFKELDNKCVGK